MIIIKKNEKDSIDRMLKRFKYKLKRTKLIRQIRDGREFEKPSMKKRKEKLKAIHIQKLRDNERNNC